MKRILLLAFAQCLVLGALTSPAVVGLSLRVRELVNADASAGALGAIISAGSVAAMIANPLFGWLADRTGRRRSILSTGAIAGLIAICFVVWAPTVLCLALAWVLTQAAYNMCFGAVNGLVSDGLAAADRTRAAGVLSSVTVIGTLPGLMAAALLPDDVAGMMLAVPMIAAIALPIVASRLPLGSAGVTRDVGRGIHAVRAVVSLPFVAVFIVRLVIALELAAGLVFALYLFVDRWHLDETSAVRLVSLTTVIGAAALAGASALIAATPLRRAAPSVLLGCALAVLAVATVARSLAPDVLTFQLATAVAGAAIGAGFTASRSIAQSLLPSAQSALGLGVFNAASTLAPAIAPVLAGALVVPGIVPGQHDGYGAMYIALAIPVAASLALVPTLRRAGVTADAKLLSRDGD